MCSGGWDIACLLPSVSIRLQGLFDQRVNLKETCTKPNAHRFREETTIINWRHQCHLAVYVLSSINPTFYWLTIDVADGWNLQSDDEGFICLDDPGTYSCTMCNWHGPWWRGSGIPQSAFIETWLLLFLVLRSRCPIQSRPDSRC